MQNKPEGLCRGYISARWGLSREGERKNCSWWKNYNIYEDQVY